MVIGYTCNIKYDSSNLSFSISCSSSCMFFFEYASFLIKDESFLNGNTIKPSEGITGLF